MDSTAQPAPTEQKFSRYRSTRRARQGASPPPAASSPPPAEGANVNRSRSRYHRPTTAHGEQAQQHAPASQSPEHAGPGALDDRDTAPAQTTSSEEEEQAERRRRQLHDKYERRKEARLAAAERPTYSSGEGEDLSKADPQQRRHKSARAEREVPRPVRSDAPREIRATPAVEEDEGGAGCFGLFKRKRGEELANEKIPAARHPSPRRNGNEPATIRPGGGGVVPGTDAPVSAVNAGDRRVLVECNKSSIFLPVTPTTTSVDLINSAANCLSERIDPKASVLLEDFGKAGVQRPLRRYEHVRDVMNSWDDDKQNALIVVPSAAAGVNINALTASHVPQGKPAETSFVMYYSQKVGSWDKRLITIRQDGQVVMTKKPKDKDTTNICHLSDYDIYMPTAKQMSKKIRPPKKMCFAIKSQQKTSMFMSTNNYVHFFCTSDRTSGTDFYDAVHSWRSWYLVNVMGEGKKQTRTAPELASPERRTGATAYGSPPQQPAASHQHHASDASEMSRYQLGSFKPLVDLSDFDARPASSHSQTQAEPTNNQLPTRRVSTRDRKHPPSSLPRHLQLADDEPLANLANNRRGSLDVTQTQPSPSSRDTFAASGLLGRSYSQRQRAAQEREKQERETAANPFTSGPNLLNGGGGGGGGDLPHRTASTRRPDTSSGCANASDLRRGPSTRNRGSVDLARSASTRAGREPPKPLVDLTPRYREPPQHVKKGKGFRPDQVGPGGLVENATSPEDLIGAPPAQDWRGRNHANVGASRAHGAAAAGRSQQQQQQHARPYATPSPHAAGGALINGAANRDQLPGRGGEETAFTGGGLLAHAGQGFGGQTTGRGVMSGNAAGRSGKPMLDVQEQSRYVPGSLLAGVERSEGPRGPVVDRSGE